VEDRWPIAKGAFQMLLLVLVLALALAL